MTFWKTAALSAALLGAAGVGAAVAPVVHGQSSTRVFSQRPVEMFTIGGGRLGVSVSETEAGEAKGPGGVVIDSVEEGSPAETAGLRKGDVVVEFDGERVRSVRQFTRLVSETPAGRQVGAAVMRDGQRVSLNVTTRAASSGDLRDFTVTVPPIPARPARPTPAPRAPRPPMLENFLFSSGSQLGVMVTDLSDQLREHFGVKNGILVASVTEDSVAAKAGVKAGDIIVSINGDTVDDAADIRRSMQRLDSGAEVTLTVVRDRKSMTLKGKTEANSNRRWTTRTIL